MDKSIEVTPIAFTHCENGLCRRPAIFKCKLTENIYPFYICESCLSKLQKKRNAHIRMVKVTYLNEELPLVPTASHNPEHEAAHPDVLNFREPETQVAIERERRKRAKSNKEKLNALRSHLSGTMFMFQSQAKEVKYNSQTFYVLDGYAFTKKDGKYTPVYKVDKKGKFSYLTAD
jgi:hypothetical protein